MLLTMIFRPVHMVELKNMSIELVSSSSGQNGCYERGNLKTDLILLLGRTGRIGNKGLATSFFNERDEDIAEELTKILLETGQPVPDFLQHHAPEEGTHLKFEADSDSGEEGEAAAAEDGENGEGDEAGGGWGTGNGGDASAASAQPKDVFAPASGGWGKQQNRRRLKLLLKIPGALASPLLRWVLLLHPAGRVLDLLSTLQLNQLLVDWHIQQNPK
jgi:hypothetical protein